MPQRRNRSGNRLPVPSSLRSHHFFYKTAAPCPIADLEKLGNLIKPLMKHRVLADTIAVVDRPTIVTECGRRARAAWDRIACALPALVQDAEDELEVLGCHWTEPHVDVGFCGYAFYNLVLSTGPFAYRMQTLHTTRRLEGDDHLLEVVKSTRSLKVGDVFVFDPTTPHIVFP
jgi:hypothetical protein